MGGGGGGAQFSVQGTFGSVRSLGWCRGASLASGGLKPEILNSLRGDLSNPVPVWS